MLKVKRLDPKAILPTVGHAGEDLAYDVYALEDTTLHSGRPVKVRTGIAAAFDLNHVRKNGPQYGLLIRDRSSVAARGIFVTGGVVDAGYRGEIIVVMTTSYAPGHGSEIIKAGDKIAQMIPLPALTGKGVEEVDAFEEETQRGDAGFGSTGAAAEPVPTPAPAQSAEQAQNKRELYR